MFRRKIAISGCGALLVLILSAGIAFVPKDASAFTNWILVQVPYAGTWNYANNAPPATHHRPWSGDWATDYYNPPGTWGRFYLTTSDGGATKYGVVASVGSSCQGADWAGIAYKFNMYDGSGYRGYYVTAHVQDLSPYWQYYDLAQGQYMYDGYLIGWTYRFPRSDCYQVNYDSGVHWHIEMEQPSQYSCYYPWSPSAYLASGSTMGAIGSNATGYGAPCW
jgi:hypothetical protein